MLYSCACYNFEKNYGMTMLFFQICPLDYGYLVMTSNSWNRLGSVSYFRRVDDVCPGLVTYCVRAWAPVVRCPVVTPGNSGTVSGNKLMQTTVMSSRPFRYADNLRGNRSVWSLRRRIKPTGSRRTEICFARPCRRQRLRPGPFT